jgi:hypothetical protein
MMMCELVDYSERPESLIMLYECPAVTVGDIAAINDFLPDQSAQIREGDDLTIYIVDNRTEGVKWLLTIWHNKGKACIDTGDGNVWGDWEEAAKLIVTEEYEEAEDDDGMEVMGRIAYNSHGMRGIYSQRRFFTLRDYAMEARAI